MIIRTYEEADQDPILKLANKINKDTHEFTPLTPKLFQRWKQDSHLLILVAEDEEIAGFAAAERGWPAEPGEIQVSMLCIEPAANANRIEKELLDRCQKEAGAKSILTTIPIGDPRIKSYEEWGFQLDGGYLQLTRSLAKMPPQPALIEGVVIRSLKEGEEEEFVSLLNTSYAGTRLTMKELEGWQSSDPLFNYDWIQVAEYEGRLIGAGVARGDLEYNEYYHDKRGYLGPSGTLPEFRGRGLNKSINWHAMNTAKRHGMTSVMLYTHEANFPVLKLTNEFGYTIIYHWKLLRRGISRSQQQ